MFLNFHRQIYVQSHHQKHVHITDINDQCSQHKDSHESQSIYRENQLAGCYIMGTLVVNGLMYWICSKLTVKTLE